MMLPKKSLGQHFLTDRNIAAKIAASLSGFGGYTHLLEAGPGMGALTIFLLNETNYAYHGIEIDGEAVKYLERQHPGAHFVHADLLKCDLGKIAPPPFALIGNFPYNISSQILFKILDNRDDIPEVVGMFQEEVAQRICAAPGSKTYGILSVLTAAFYDVEYLFPVSEKVFRPRPRVQSAVMRLRRNTLNEPDCDPL
ncbi:MAG: 16S rRNA (adenine(1518)-N(6)/adenine(1519)-N(6))-dimethyltransferase RsmA, partial [Flavobacteriales bacterium]